MEPQQVLDEINQSMTTFRGDMDAKLAEIPEVVRRAFEGKPEAPAGDGDEAKVEQLAGVTEFEPWDIPIGKALIGGFVAVVGSELIDGFLKDQGNMVLGGVKLAAAGAVIRWGKGLLGKGGATAVALLLAYDGIRHIIPIDQYAHRLASGVSGVVTTRGLGGNQDSVIDAGNGDSGGRGIGGYYDALKGGAR